MDSSLSKYININLTVNNLSIYCYREITWSWNKYKISVLEFIMKSFSLFNVFTVWWKQIKTTGTE